MHVNHLVVNGDTSLRLVRKLMPLHPKFHFREQRDNDPGRTQKHSSISTNIIMVQTADQLLKSPLRVMAKSQSNHNGLLYKGHKLFKGLHITLCHSIVIYKLLRGVLLISAKNGKN